MTQPSTTDAHPTPSAEAAGRPTRRQVLKVLGTTAAALVLDPAQLAKSVVATARTRGSASWHNANTWGGRIPGARSVAVISRKVVLRKDVRVAGVIIKKGGSLVVRGRRRLTLTSTGNVIVRGTLEMGPGAVLQFLNVNESAFVGGGMDPVASDLGLWVMDQGRLKIQGTPKKAWTRAAGSLAAGATSIALAEAPTGWQSGDEIAITPTLPPTASSFSTAYDTVKVLAVNGQSVLIDRPLRFAHPAVEVAPGKVMAAEVLNLTRDVRIEGTPLRRTHIFIRSTSPQTIRNVAIRHVGPRKNGKFVLGRYGLHFHHCHDANRGVVVEGVVIRDAGSHAFVPHMTNGLTLRECLAHSTQESAFWWDLGEPTNDALWERCVASATLVGDDKYTNEQFTHGTGSGNVCLSSVAVGGQGSVNSTGFEWPSKGASGVWRFEDCVAHNIQTNGLFGWQVDSPVHLIERFTAYHVGGAGIFHGSYSNRYHYRDAILYGNRGGGLEVHALSKAPDAAGNVLTFENILVDGAGVAPFAVQVRKHVTPPEGVGRFLRCQFKGYTKAAIGYTADKGEAEWFEAVDCSYSGNEFWFADTIRPESFLRVRDEKHGTITLRRRDQAGGTYAPAWNASVVAE